MTTYSISVDDGRHPVEHIELNLPDVEAAWTQATRIMGAILENSATDFRNAETWQVSVQCNGLLLFQLHTLVVDAPAMGRRRKS